MLRFFRENPLRDNTAGVKNDESSPALCGGAASGAGPCENDQPEGDGERGAEPANLLDLAELPNGTVAQGEA